MKLQDKAKELKEKSINGGMGYQIVHEAKLSQVIECWKQQHADLHEIFGWLAVCNKDEYVLQVSKSIKEKIANLEETIKLGEEK
jgi:hypothetical protein